MKYLTLIYILEFCTQKPNIKILTAPTSVLKKYFAGTCQNEHSQNGVQEATQEQHMLVLINISFQWGKLCTFTINKQAV